MSTLEFERRKRSSVGLNMTPLIDMVFLLLIFFVLSSHFISESGFKIKLPKAVSAQTQKNEHLTVFIDKDGRVFLNNAQVRLKQLRSLVRSELYKANSKTVVIKADEDVSLRLVVTVMDIAKDASADGLVISTKMENNEKNK